MSPKWFADSARFRFAGWFRKSSWKKFRFAFVGWFGKKSSRKFRFEPVIGFVRP
jgi:hypothetical protein